MDARSLKDRVLIRTTTGIEEVKGKILEGGIYAITGSTTGIKSYTVTHIPTGLSVCNNRYDSLNELWKEITKILERADAFVERHEVFIKNDIKQFNDIIGVVPIIQLEDDYIKVEQARRSYKDYAQSVRKRSKIAVCYDKAMKEINKGLLNGYVMSDSSGYPYMYSCTVGNGYEFEGKKVYYHNMYEINFYSGLKGCTIYKSSEKSSHNKMFQCGKTIENFKGCGFHGIEVNEDLELEEVIMLCNKDWTTFSNVKENMNKNNIEFLKLMKKRLIKTLLYNDIIVLNKTNKYVDKQWK